MDSQQQAGCTREWPGWEHHHTEPTSAGHGNLLLLRGQTTILDIHLLGLSNLLLLVEVHLAEGDREIDCKRCCSTHFAVRTVSG